MWKTKSKQKRKYSQSGKIVVPGIDTTKMLVQQEKENRITIVNRK